MRKTDTPANLPRAKAGKKSRSPMDLLRANKSADAVRSPPFSAFACEFTIMMGSRDTKGQVSETPTGSQTVQGTLLYLRYGVPEKVARTVMHMLGDTMVLSDYRTGYKLCDVDYSIGFRERGENPGDLRAAHDSFAAFLARHGAAKYELALSKLPTVNVG